MTRLRPPALRVEHAVRLVLDTNTVISGLLWGGPPRKLIDLALADEVALFTSRHLLDEAADVLARPKLARRLAQIGATPADLMEAYRQLATEIAAPPLGTPVCDDPDDDHVLACALAAQATVIVSGDDDLLRLGSYSGITITPAATFLQTFAPPPESQVNP